MSTENFWRPLRCCEFRKFVCRCDFWSRLPVTVPKQTGISLKSVFYSPAQFFCCKKKFWITLMISLRTKTHRSSEIRLTLQIKRRALNRKQYLSRPLVFSLSLTKNQFWKETNQVISRIQWVLRSNKNEKISGAGSVSEEIFKNVVVGVQPLQFLFCLRRGPWVAVLVTGSTDKMEYDTSGTVIDKYPYFTFILKWLHSREGLQAGLPTLRIFPLKYGIQKMIRISPDFWVSKFSNFLQILKFFDFFRHFLS